MNRIYNCPTSVINWYPLRRGVSEMKFEQPTCNVEKNDCLAIGDFSPGDMVVCCATTVTVAAIIIAD